MSKYKWPLSNEWLFSFGHIFSFSPIAGFRTSAVGAEWQDIQIPLSSLQSTNFLLLLRPYPGF